VFAYVWMSILYACIEGSCVFAYVWMSILYACIEGSCVSAWMSTLYACVYCECTACVRMICRYAYMSILCVCVESVDYPKALGYCRSILESTEISADSTTLLQHSLGYSQDLTTLLVLLGYSSSVIESADTLCVCMHAREYCVHACMSSLCVYACVCICVHA